MEAWRQVWREGFAPIFSAKSLLAMRHGLLTDDPRLIQGATTTPPPLHCVQDWPVEAGDLLAYGHWIGECGGICEVAKAEEYFARSCHQCDLTIGEPAACRHFLNWYDETPRDNMRVQLLPEVSRALWYTFAEPAKKIMESMGECPLEIVADRLNDAGHYNEEEIVRTMATPIMGRA